MVNRKKEKKKIYITNWLPFNFNRILNYCSPNFWNEILSLSVLKKGEGGDDADIIQTVAAPTKDFFFSSYF